MAQEQRSDEGWELVADAGWEEVKPAPDEYQEAIKGTRTQFIPPGSPLSGTAIEAALALAEQPGAGVYGLATQAYAGLKGLYKGAIGAVAGLPFGETFREEFNATAQNAADAYVPLTPGGELLTHKLSELLTGAVQKFGDVMGASMSQLITGVPKGEPVPGPAAAAQATGFAALLFAPFGPKPKIGVRPEFEPAPLGVLEDFALRYPEAAKAMDASSLGAVRFRREDTSILEAVTRQMDTELGLKGTTTEIPFRAKALAVFEQIAPDVPVGERMRAVQALEAKVKLLDDVRTDIADRRGLPAPKIHPFDEPITVTDKGMAITAGQARMLRHEFFVVKTPSERANALAVSLMGQLRVQAENVLKQAEGSGTRAMEMSALQRMWRQSFPDEYLGGRDAALDKFLNFGGRLTYPQVLEALGPTKKTGLGAAARAWKKSEAGMIDIEGMDYILQSFKDLPDQPILKRATIVGQLNRMGVPQAEKDAVMRAMRDRDSITQQELVGSVAANILPLKPREVVIQKDTAASEVLSLRTAPPGTPTVVRIWDMPTTTEMHNIFNDKRYFAHTRSYERGGIRHIAEIQSELMQGEMQATAGTKLPVPKDIGRIAPLEKRWYERILMEENRQASRDGVRTMRVATADTTAKTKTWLTAPGEPLPPKYQGLYNFYKTEVGSFVRNRFGAKEVVDEFNNSWWEWPVRADAATEKIPAFGGRQRGMIDIPEFEDVVRAARGAETAAERAAERGWTTPQPAGDELYSKVRGAFDKSRLAEEESHRITAKDVISRVRRETVAHDYDLRAELDRAGPYGQRAVGRLAVQNGATMSAKTLMDNVNERIFNQMDSATKTSVDELMRLRRIIEIDSYKGVGKHKHPEGITGPQAEAVALRMQRELGPEQFARVYEFTNRVMAEYKDILNRRHVSGLLSDESYLKLLHFDYSPTEFIDLIDPLQTFTVHGRPITVRTSGVPFLERGKRGEAVMDSQLLLAEALVRSENLIFRNNTVKSLYALAKEVPDNQVVRLPAEGMVGKAGTPDAYVKHTPKGWTSIGVRQEGGQEFIFMREDLAEQFIHRPQVMSDFVNTMFRIGSGQAAVKATATTYNPGFVVAGLPMDILHTWLASSTYSPHLPVAAGQMVMDLGATMADAWLPARRNAPGSRFQQSMREGLGSAFMTHEGRGISGVTEKSMSVAERQMMPRFEGLKKALSYINESADIWVRMAHRERLIKQGVEPAEATAQARNRLDYSAGGQFTRAVDTVIPYTNVAVQALSKVIQQGAKDSTETGIKLAWGGGAITATVLANMISSPETWQQIPTSDKIRSLPITFGDQWYITDPDGNRRYIYAPGVRLDATVGPIAATIVAGLESAEYGKAPDAVLSKSLANLNPVVEFQAPPVIEAIKTYLSNFDAFTGRPVTPHAGQVLPQNEGLTYGRGEPSSLVSRAVGESLGLSPPRLDAAARKVINPNNTYLSLMGWGYKALFADDPRTQAEDATLQLLRNPAVRPFLKLTNPSTQYLQQVDDVKMAEGSRRKQMTDSVDNLLFQVRHQQATIDEVKTYIRNQAPEDREWLGNYATTTYKVKEIMGRFGASEDIPNESWWRSVSALEARPRAQEFYSQWLSASPEGRARMERIAAGLHNAGAGFMSDNFRRELSKERELLGTERR